MPYRERHASLLRSDLAPLEGLTEKPMFGGLAFLLHGNMVCGVRNETGMFRVGKPNEPSALEVSGTRPMTMTGRPMGGIVETTVAVLVDDQRRRRLIDLALGYVRTLEPK